MIRSPDSSDYLQQLLLAVIAVFLRDSIIHNPLVLRMYYIVSNTGSMASITHPTIHGEFLAIFVPTIHEQLLSGRTVLSVTPDFGPCCTLLYIVSVAHPTIHDEFVSICCTLLYIVSVAHPTIHDEFVSICNDPTIHGQLVSQSQLFI